MITEEKFLRLDLSDIRRLTTADFSGRRMTGTEFTHIAKLVGGYWAYLGEPRPNAPHMELQSGLHGIHYINCSLVLAETNICEILADQMVEYCIGEDIGEVQWVVTAALAGVPLGCEIARQIGARAGFVEKGKDGELTKWRFQIPADERVLLVNELITTPDGSIFKTKQTVAKENPEQVKFLPFAALMVDRCFWSMLGDGTEIHSIFKFQDLPTFAPADCPYCKAGSLLIRGKASFRQLWQEQLAYQREQSGEVNWQAGGQ